MYITSPIRFTINVSDCIGIFVTEDNIIKTFKKIYENICFSQHYIVSINHIMRLSECVINKDGSPNFGTITGICDTTSIKYAPGEIINGCTVVPAGSNSDSIILCETDIADIALLRCPELNSITSGQKISIRVGMVQYNHGVSKIAINAIPYSINKTPIIYAINAKIKEFVNYKKDNKKFFDDILTRITDEKEQMELLKKNNSKAWNTFNQLLYAYKTPQNAPDNVAVKDINDILTNGCDKNIYLSRDPRLNLSDPLVYVYHSQSDFPSDSMLISNHSPTDVILLLMEDYCAHLRTIREMIEIYNTEEIISNHANLWRMFTSSKIAK